MSPTAVRIPAIALEITRQLREKFQNNLYAVLLYGSSQHREKYWDLDILVILKRNYLTSSDFDILQEIAREYSSQSLDLQALYLSELKNPDVFALDAHGAFFSRILQRASLLYGTNPFSRTYEPARKVFLISLITRIQRYVFHARQEYILGGRHNKDRNPKYHQKHVIRSMFDVLLMSREWLEPEEVHQLFESKFPGIISADEWDILESQSDDIEDYLLLYEKVYSVALIEVEQLLTEPEIA